MRHDPLWRVLLLSCAIDVDLSLAQCVCVCVCLCDVQEKLKRTCVGIWTCKGCKKTIAGGAYVPK